MFLRNDLVLEIVAIEGIRICFDKSLVVNV